MKNAVRLLLGVVTSIGGFIEAGSISTSAQAGALFGFQLLWAIALAATCVAFLVEMSGRLAAVSGHTLAAAVRERFGVTFHIGPIVAELVLDVLVLTAEIGGVCVAVQLLTGRPLRLWVLPVAFLAWLLLWIGNFDSIENSVALLGLVTLCFVVAAGRLQPSWGELARGFIPSVPGHHGARYGFLAVSIFGATISPYLLNFYSSGAVEEKWTEKDCPLNRVVAFSGMGFGAVVSMGVLVCAALVLKPRGITADSFSQIGLVLTPAFGKWGFYLFAVSLGIGCLGAALEVALNMAYLLGQSLGWSWGENLRPKDGTRFSLVFTLAIGLAAVLVLLGLDPLRLTLFSMALTVLILPILVLPFLVLMNDRQYVRDHTNGWIGNAVVGFVIVAGFLMALVAIPLQILGGS
jgi:Mn2+/Fe2+ NRAMP family transporter